MKEPVPSDRDVEERHHLLAPDELLSWIGHGLRMPLATVAGLAELVLEGGFSAEKRDELLRALAGSARSSLGLVDGLVEVLGLVSGERRIEPADVDARAVVNRRASMSPQLSVVDAEAAPVSIRVDPQLFERALENLVLATLATVEEDEEVAIDCRAVEGSCTIELRARLELTESARASLEAGALQVHGTVSHLAAARWALAQQVAVAHGGRLAVDDEAGLTVIRWVVPIVPVVPVDRGAC